MTRKTERKSLVVAALLTAMLLVATFGAGPGPGPPTTSAADPAFVVNSLGDQPDANVGNGVCATSGGQCTLRAAIQESNINPDANTITFSVAGIISLTTELPDLFSGNITIAGANQTVTIDGSGLPGGTPCLHLTSDSNAARGLVIANCAGNGVQINGASNVIGGTTASQRNVVRDGAASGIAGFGDNVTGNLVLGNYIGVAQNGSEAAPNNWDGVVFGFGANGNTIGGSSAGARNVISGNSPAIRLGGGAPWDNVVEGNYIGLDASGSFAIPNWRGVWIDDGASGNSILDNVISGNGYGIAVGTLLYSLSGDPTDTIAPIDLDGHINVYIGGPAPPVWAEDSAGGQVPAWSFDANKSDWLTIELTQVGATCGSGTIWLKHVATGENVEIPGYSGGCPGNGEVFYTWSEYIEIPFVDWSAADNVIQDNRIGTNAAGDEAVPNGTGIRLMGDARSTVIGGPDGEGNLISGNWDRAVDADPSEGTVIQGNLIGTDAGGDYDIGNGGLGGTVATGSGAIVGGTTPGERNVISGNWSGGVLLSAGAGGSTVSGNYIGTDASGTNSLPNSGNGITIISGGNVVGDSEPGSGNLIATNSSSGIFIMWEGTDGNVVRGNTIIYNGSFGIGISDGADNNTIEGNQIGASQAAGVLIGGLWYTLSGSENWSDPPQIDDAVRVVIRDEEVAFGTTQKPGFGFLSLIANPGDTLEVQVLTNGDDCGSVGPLWLHHMPTGNKVQLTAGVEEWCPGQGEEVWSTSYTIDFPAEERIATGNAVRGNNIGTDWSGNTAMPNNRSGVRIIGSSAQNVIGGDAPRQGNVISGNNGSGIFIFSGSQNDVIQGNLIGVNGAGTAALPNSGGMNDGGIAIGRPWTAAVGGTLIGGTTPGARNVISGNWPKGIEMWLSTRGVSVKGNYIGTNAAGDAAVGNGQQGIEIFLGAHDNTIGGPTAAERNVISGNSQAGVQMWWGANHNVVEGNYIGLSADGSTALPNGWPAGVDIYDGAGENEVRGNVISGNNGGSGVSVGEVQYSLAGANDDFFARVSLDDHIVIVQNDSPWSVFSGDAEEGSIGNVFFRGNPGDELTITVTSDDACASVGPIWLHHLATGSVQVTTGASNGCSGQPVVINHVIPIPVSYSAAWNVIEDNRIGTDPAGNSAIPNGNGGGIMLRGTSSNTIIGSPGHGNVISGNEVQGISISRGSANDVIQGNLIGVNAAGNAPLPNMNNGIYFWAGAGVGTIIGGSAPGEGNVISGNSHAGVGLTSSPQGVVVRGNFIGTNAFGAALGNGHDGVLILDGAHDNLVGGAAPGQGNVIAFNHYEGVRVDGPSTVRDTIRGNSVHSNWGEGIGLGNGGNAELPAPVITSLGPVTGTACANCIVDVYSDAENEGRIWHGSTVANASGNFTFAGAVSGPAVTATATDGSGNTSRFSNPALLPGVAIVRTDVATLPPGGQVTVGVRAFDVPPPGIGAFTIDIAYDPTAVTPTGCTVDPDSHFDGEFCSTSYRPDVVRVGGFRAADGADGDLLLANVTFQVVGPSCCWSPLMLTIPELESTVPSPIPAATQSGGLGVGVFGDANRSGAVQMTDAMMIAQVVVGLRPPADIDQTMGDVNCSGGVSMVDAMLVAQHVAFGRAFTCWPCG
jgi:CSLREA domain-containing protein